MKRRITMVVDDVQQLSLVERMSVTYSGVTIESVEDIPDPDRVQEFRVRVVTKATAAPWTASHVDSLLHNGKDRLNRWTVTVTEVVSTEVER